MIGPLCHTGSFTRLKAESGDFFVVYCVIFFVHTLEKARPTSRVDSAFQKTASEFETEERILWLDLSKDGQ